MVAAIVVLTLVAAGGVLPAQADSGARTYTFLIATGSLCGLASDACPAIAMADNGDTVEITGGGTFSNRWHCQHNLMLPSALRAGCSSFLLEKEV